MDNNSNLPGPSSALGKRKRGSGDPDTDHWKEVWDTYLSKGPAMRVTQGGHPVRKLSERLKAALDYEISNWEPPSVYRSNEAADSLHTNKDTIFMNVVKQLDGFKDPISGEPITREVLQARFHKAMMVACMPAIFKEELETKKQLILRRYHVDEIKTKVQVFAARRIGKTFSVCMLFAALLLHVPGISIAAFGVSLRSAEMIIKETYDLLRTAESFGEFAVARNVQRISLSYGGSTSVLKAYPASTNVSDKYKTNFFFLKKKQKFLKKILILIDSFFF